MIGVTELKSGTIFEDKGQICQVLSYEHIKMGRGSANIKVKVRNVKTGATTIKSFINGARVNEMKIPKKDMQFLYKDADFLYFMNLETYEQIQVPLEKFPDYEYLKDSGIFTISFLEGEPLALNLPPKMEFAIAETGPSLRGNSATNIYKDAVLENGLKTRVPLFINTGDSVRIDTRTGEYCEKV